MKKLLLLNANRFESQFVLSARNMGYYVLTTGNNTNHPAHRFADQYISCDNSDYEAIVDLIQKERIDAICQGVTDRCALLASYVGDKIGLKGHDSFKSALTIHLKNEFKKYAVNNGIKTPRAMSFTSKEDAIEALSEIQFPVIIKPSDRGGGQGISIAKRINEGKNAINHAFNWSINKKIVIEQLIEGTLHSMTTFLVNKKVVAYGTANDYSFINQYMTNAGCFPADNEEEAVKQLIPQVEKIASDLNEVDGLMHFQYMVDKEGTHWIIEMMRRSPGNRYLSALSNSTGINWIEWIIRAEAGEDCSMIPAARSHDGIFGYQSILSPNDGVYKGIVISDEIKKYVFNLEEFYEPGYEVTDSANQKLGSLQFRFPNNQLKDKYIHKINNMSYALCE